MSKIRAIGLFSGGLDSIIACKLMEAEGIEVVGVYFFTPFFGNPQKVKAIADKYQIKVIVQNILEEYISGVLKDPNYGYGKNFNPCIDCHGFMLRKAGELMNSLKAKFVFTGEVLGERPFSQTYYGLKKVEELSGISGYILRPLSAKLLPETIAEKQGWVKRENLCAIKGRSRTVQFQLAEKFSIELEPEIQPSGGCLLTDPFLSKRVKSYIKRFKNYHYQFCIWELIKTGRHFILAKNTGFIIGRNQQENQVIESYKKRGIILRPNYNSGPTGILFGEKANEERIKRLASKIIASYSKKTNKLLEVVDDKGMVFKVIQKDRSYFKTLAI